MSFRFTLKTYHSCFYTVLFFLFISLPVAAQLKADFTIIKSTDCSPLSATFTNTTTGSSGSTTYKWDLGNGSSPSTLKDAGAIYIAEKTYTITLTAMDGGNSSVQTKQLTVYKKPTVDFSATPTKGCIPLPVSFTSTSIPGDGNISNYFWDFGDGNTQQGAGYQQISHTYTTPQQASISLTATNNYGCYNTTIKSIVTILGALTASFNADKTVLCTTTDPVTFTNTSSGSGTLSYLWNFGDGNSSTATSPSHTYSAKGNYAVTLTVSNTDGCSIKSTVKTINVANFTVDFTTPASVCKSDNVTFTDNSTPGYTYESWQVDGQNYYSYYGQPFNSAGQHTVQLTATYGTCSLSASKQVTVKDAPSIQPFTVTAASFCTPPVTVSFKDNTPGATGWSWDFGDYSSKASTQTTSHTYSSQGYYWVGLTVNNADGCKASTSQYLPISNPTIYINSDYYGYNSACGSLTVNFKASPDTSIASYKWDFGDGSTSTDPTPKHTFTTAGTYSVQLSYVTKGGCKANAVYNSSITVYQKPTADFTAVSTTICGNSPVSFTDKSTGNISGWNWNFGSNYNYYNGSGYYNTTNPIIQYTDSGIYTVRLIVSNYGCSDTITKAAYIKVSPPFPKIKNALNTCTGTRGLVKFTEASKYALSWQWNFGDGTIQTFTSKQDTVAHTYTKTGTYKVLLTTTNGSCTVSDSITVYVLLKQAPVLSSTQTEICSSDVLNVTINNLEANPSYNYSYYNDYSISNWQYGDATFYPGYSSNNYDWTTVYTGTLSTLNPAEKSIRAIINSAYFYCADTTNYIAIKVKGPIVGFKITTNNVCFKSPVVFQDTSKGTNNIGIKTWQWNFGDGTSQTLTAGGTVSHLYTAPGYYYPTLTVTDSGGCSTTTSNTYYSNQAIVTGPQASFTYSPTSVIPNTAVYFYNNSNTQGAYNTQYAWSFGDGTSSPGNLYYPSHSYPVIGVDTVTLIATNPSNGCADTTKKIIFVKNINTSFTFSSTYINNNSCPPAIVRFQNTSTNTTSVSWDFGDGSTAANQNYPSHTYLNAGVYKVTLYGYGIYGTKDSTTDSVTIKGPYAKIATDISGGCLAQTVTLSAVVINASSITWDFGDGTILQTKDTFAVHSYLTPGLYRPSLILKDNTGCPSTSSLPDTIVIDTLNISLRQSPDHFCDSAVVLFSPLIYSLAADQMHEPLFYQWSFGTGNAADTSNNSTPIVDYNKLGTYYINLKITSPYGCVKQTSDSIVIVSRSKGSINGPAGICQGGSAQFTGAATIINNNTGWNWSFYSNNTSMVQNPPAQVFNDSGTYPILLVVINNGCSDTTTKTFIVHAKPVINITPKEAGICLGKSIQLTAHDGTLYAWTSSTGLTFNGTSINVSPLVKTIYTVTVTNAFTCVASDSSAITVALPITINAPLDTTVCEGNSIQLTIIGANSYNWINTTAGLNTTQSGSVIITPKQTTTYTVVGYDAYQCFSDTASIKITTKPAPAVTAGPSVKTLGGTPIQLTTSGSNDIISWAWVPADYLSCNDCPSPVSTPQSDITYIVTVKNQYGCSDTGTVTISLICTQDFVYIPTAFTPNNDGKNDLFYIKGKGVRKINSIQIFNRWGTLVFQRMNINIDDSSAGWDGVYNGTQLEPGSYVYIAKMECDTGIPFEKQGSVILIR